MLNSGLSLNSRNRWETPQFPQPHLRHVLISSLEYPGCYSSTAVYNDVIIDTGASVCISPHKDNFKMYALSGMKIKDLSSTNKVAGEGLIQWQLQDINGNTVTIKAFG